LEIERGIKTINEKAKKKRYSDQLPGGSSSQARQPGIVLSCAEVEHAERNGGDCESGRWACVLILLQLLLVGEKGCGNLLVRITTTI
jgi:hypothetical protein